MDTVGYPRDIHGNHGDSTAAAGSVGPVDPADGAAAAVERRVEGAGGRDEERGQPA